MSRYRRKKDAKLLQVMTSFKVCRSGIEMFRVSISSLDFGRYIKWKLKFPKFVIKHVLEMKPLSQVIKYLGKIKE